MWIKAKSYIIGKLRFILKQLYANHMQIMLININEVDGKNWISHRSKKTKVAINLLYIFVKTLFAANKLVTRGKKKKGKKLHSWQCPLTFWVGHFNHPSRIQTGSTAREELLSGLAFAQYTVDLLSKISPAIKEKKISLTNCYMYMSITL